MRVVDGSKRRAQRVYRATAGVAMKWSDRIRDFVEAPVTACAYYWWLHRQERKRPTANREADRKPAERMRETAARGESTGVRQAIGT